MKTALNDSEFLTRSRITDPFPTDLIRSLLPTAAAVVEGPIPDAAESLWPEEATFVKNAVPKRFREYAAGRAFARRAMEMLDVPPASLPPKPNRSPQWPAGLIGSITHVANYCAAAVARTTDVSSIGIDVEDLQRIDPAFVSQVLSPTEMRLYGSGSTVEELKRLGALIFSAKEAIYKCLSVLAEVQLSFRDCTIELEHETGTFAMNVPPATRIFAADRRIVGHFAFAGSFIGTAISLTPGAVAGRE